MGFVVSGFRGSVFEDYENGKAVGSGLHFLFSGWSGFLESGVADRLFFGFGFIK